MAFAVAAVLHLIVGWFHLTVGLVAPLWAVVVLNAEWLVLAVLLWRWRRRSPLLLLAIPFVSALVWIVVVTAGDQWLGWSASGGDDTPPAAAPSGAPTDPATAEPTSPDDEPVVYATTSCDTPPDTFALLCEVHDLVRTSHVEPPTDAELAAAAAEAVEPGDGVDGLVCALPSEDFRVLCDAFARGGSADSAAVENAVDAMVTGALDPYSAYRNALEQEIQSDELDGEVEGVGALVTATDTSSDDPEDRTCTILSDTCRVLFVSILPDTPAERAGLEEGDLVVSVDGEDVRGLTLDEVVDRVRGPAGTEVTLTVERDGEEVTVTPVREAIELTVVEHEVMGDTGYLRLLIFTSNADELFREALRELVDAGVERIVLDLRDNPGGALDAAVTIASEFLADGVVLRTEAPDETRPYPVESGGLAVDGPELVVVVDRGSASASEVVAGALQDAGRAVLVGEDTFGKNTVQQTFTLDDGGALKLTIARWVTPAGRDFGEVGIAPDVELELPADLERDEVVERVLTAVDEAA